MTGDKGKTMPMVVSLAIYGEYLPIPFKSNNEENDNQISIQEEIAYQLNTIETIVPEEGIFLSSNQDSHLDDWVSISG